MKYLITRSSVFDMACVAMIQGAMTGLGQLDRNPQFAAIVRPYNNADNPICPTFIDPDDIDEAFNWAEVVLDIGGRCKDTDLARMEYIKRSKKKDIPYIYMAQSFFNPDMDLVKDMPVVARGYHAACEIRKATGAWPSRIGADLSFLIEPVPWHGPKYRKGYTTYSARPWRNMSIFKEDAPVQIILKPERAKVYEPILEMPGFHGSPAETFGLIETLEEVHTARYHTGVGAVMCKKPVRFYVDINIPKYDDLMSFNHLTRQKLKDLAMLSCEFVIDVIKGWNNGIRSGF